MTRVPNVGDDPPFELFHVDADTFRLALAARMPADKSPSSYPAPREALARTYVELRLVDAGDEREIDALDVRDELGPDGRPTGRVEIRVWFRPELVGLSPR